MRSETRVSASFPAETPLHSSMCELHVYSDRYQSVPGGPRDLTKCTSNSPGYSELDLSLRYVPGRHRIARSSLCDAMASCGATSDPVDGDTEISDVAGMLK